MINISALTMPQTKSPHRTASTHLTNSFMFIIDSI
jgi:hypothetical protein